jgi:hypothetical protein
VVIGIADAHRGDGRRFIVRAEEKNLGIAMAARPGVETTALRSLRVKFIYEGRGLSPSGRSGGTKICFSPCYAEVNNRMLNTQSRVKSVSVSEIGPYSYDHSSRVVEHTRSQSI